MISINVNQNNNSNLVSDDGRENVPQVDAFEVATIGWSQIALDVLDSSQNKDLPD